MSYTIYPAKAAVKAANIDGQQAWRNIDVFVSNQAEAIDAIDQAKDDAVSQIGDYENQVIQARDNAITNIEATEQTAIGNINSEKLAAIENINAVENRQERIINNGLTLDTETADMIAEDFDESQDYPAGTYVRKTITSDDTAVVKLFKLITGYEANNGWDSVEKVEIKISDELSDLNNTVNVLSDAIGISTDTNTPIDMDIGFYSYDYSNTLTVNPTINSNQTSYRCSMINCNPGEIFKIIGRGYGNSARLYIFTDAQYNMKKVATKNTSLTEEDDPVGAPPESVYLFINAYLGGTPKINPIVYRVNTTKDKIASLETEMSDMASNFETEISNITSNFETEITDITSNFETEISDIKSNIYKISPLPQLGIAFGQWGLNAKTGSRALNITYRLTLDGYLPEYIKSLSVADDATDYYFRLCAWDKTTKEYVGMWNGTGYGFMTTDLSVNRANLKNAVLSEFGDYNFKITIDGPYGANETMPLSDASKILGQYSITEVLKQRREKENTPENYQGKEICVFNKMVCIGDSIIAGGGRRPKIPGKEDVPTPKVMRKYSIPTLLHKMYGIETVNLGVSGCTSESWNNNHTADDLAGGYDSALIRIGNNDYNYREAPPDGHSENAAQAAARSKTNIKEIIDKLKKANPGIRIFLCTLSKSNSTDGLAQYRVPLMEAIRQIPNEHIDPSDNNSPLYGESVFIVDTNQHSNYQAVGGYYYGHPTAIGYQAIAQDIGNIISYIIKTNNDKFKWIPWINTDFAVTDGMTLGQLSDNELIG